MILFLCYSSVTFNLFIWFLVFSSIEDMVFFFCFKFDVHDVYNRNWSDTVRRALGSPGRGRQAHRTSVETLRRGGRRSHPKAPAQPLSSDPPLLLEKTQLSYYPFRAKSTPSATVRLSTFSTLLSFFFIWLISRTLRPTTVDEAITPHMHQSISLSLTLHISLCLTTIKGMRTYRDSDNIPSTFEPLLYRRNLPLTPYVL